MEKTRKNPLLAGLLNMLLPGSVNIYVRNKPRNFILTFIGMGLLLAVLVWVGSSLQATRSFNLPQGLCPGALVLLVLVPLFIAGLNAATEHNKILDDGVLYQSRQEVSQDTDDEQMKKIQKMRDEGLISEQQYEKRKDKIAPKK